MAGVLIWPLSEGIRRKKKNKKVMNIEDKIKTESKKDSSRGLLKLGGNGAQWLLQQGFAFQPFFIYVAKDSLVGCVRESPDKSADDVVDTIRHLAVAENVTEGIFVALIDQVSTSTPVASVQQFVLLVYQSRTHVLTFIAPVLRNADGTFSHLGQGKQAYESPWPGNIVPKQKPGESERLASKRLLKNRKFVVEI